MSARIAKARRGAARACVLAVLLSGLHVSAGETPKQGEPPIATTSEDISQAAAATASDTPDLPVLPVGATHTRNGREIYHNFISGLADQDCASEETKPRWKQHFKHAPKQLTQPNTDLLPLFGYVVDAMREAGLPTEYALIPFVESGYKPAARSKSGPAGMWQFIGTTARNQGVTMQGGYDGRLSPVESTQAAVRYLKILHTMFGKDWRLAVMGYNAGEYRVLQSMRRAGMNASNARPAELPGLSGITYAYVEKLHAIACLLKRADDNPQWLASLDRDVPHLKPQEFKGASLDAWARQQGHDPALLQRLNPALANSAIRNPGKPLRVLAPGGIGGFQPSTEAPVITDTSERGDDLSTPTGKARTHTVRSGESAWTIAKRYGLSATQLLSRNQLSSRSVLRPGMVLNLDSPSKQ